MKKKLQQLMFLPVLALLFTACNGKKEAEKTAGEKPMTTSAGGEDMAKAKESFNAVYAAIQSGDLSKLGDHIDAGVVEHDPNLPGGTATGIDVSKKFMTDLKQGFPDLKIELKNIVGEGDMMYAMVRLTGTNTGAMAGMPATNKKVDFLAVDVVKLKNGKAIEHWNFNDNITMLRQLGMMPDAPPPAK